MPYEPMHAEKIGLAKKFLSSFLASMTDLAVLEMNVRMTKFPLVPPWHRGLAPMLLTSSSKLDDRHVKTNATSAGRTCCVLGLVLLKESHFRKAS